MSRDRLLASGILSFYPSRARIACQSSSKEGAEADRTYAREKSEPITGETRAIILDVWRVACCDVQVLTLPSAVASSPLLRRCRAGARWVCITRVEVCS